jgi:putative oxidoreductase
LRHPEVSLSGVDLPTNLRTADIRSAARFVPRGWYPHEEVTMRGNDWHGYVFTVLRVIAGAMFACHGLQKLFGLFGGMGGHGAVAHFGTQLWLAGALETVGGILIVLGLLTRPTAFILCGEMAVAYFSVHLKRGFWPLLNGGEPAVLYCFIFLYLVAVGSGPLSLDRALGRK